MNAPKIPADRYALQPGVFALPQSLLWLERSATLVAADAHFGYEDVIGGALPLWSTAESLTLLTAAIERCGARELVLLGDIIHGTRMSDGAAATISAALARLRSLCTLTLVAGNHEGASRGVKLLGEAHESLVRDGWLLLHGDEAVAGIRCIIGHLHPSIPLGGDRSAPAFLHTADLIVVPALTPYSRGLNVLSAACSRALRTFVPSTRGFELVVSGSKRVYPFGSLAAYKTAGIKL